MCITFSRILKPLTNIGQFKLILGEYPWGKYILGIAQIGGKYLKIICNIRKHFFKKHFFSYLYFRYLDIWNADNFGAMAMIILNFRNNPNPMKRIAGPNLFSSSCNLIILVITYAFFHRKICPKKKYIYLYILEV